MRIDPRSAGIPSLLSLAVMSGGKRENGVVTGAIGGMAPTGSGVTGKSDSPDPKRGACTPGSAGAVRAVIGGVAGGRPAPESGPATVPAGAKIEDTDIHCGALARAKPGTRGKAALAALAQAFVKADMCPPTP